ncbi:NusA N-terminal domain-containing protein, partial [Pseudomonas aeruginosa]|uniref:NusA N-terminal domain-containing protein n=1 Tax=Pseudomonas aeruginosa TaxID=287 RepID=UPI003CC57FDB
VHLRVEFNRLNCSYETFRRWLVVADVDFQHPATEITVAEGAERNTGAKHGVVTHVMCDCHAFGRIDGQPGPPLNGP